MNGQDPAEHRAQERALAEDDLAELDQKAKNLESVFLAIHQDHS